MQLRNPSELYDRELLKDTAFHALMLLTCLVNLLVLLVYCLVWAGAKAYEWYNEPLRNVNLIEDVLAVLPDEPTPDSATEKVVLYLRDRLDTELTKVIASKKPSEEITSPFEWPDGFEEIDYDTNTPDESAPEEDYEEWFKRNSNLIKDVLAPDDESAPDEFDELYAQRLNDDDEDVTTKLLWTEEEFELADDEVY